MRVRSGRGKAAFSLQHYPTLQPCKTSRFTHQRGMRLLLNIPESFSTAASRIWGPIIYSRTKDYMCQITYFYILVVRPRALLLDPQKLSSRVPNACKHHFNRSHFPWRIVWTGLKSAIVIVSLGLVDHWEDRHGFAISAWIYLQTRHDVLNWSHSSGHSANGV